MEYFGSFRSLASSFHSLASDPFFRASMMYLSFVSVFLDSTSQDKVLDLGSSLGTGGALQGGPVYIKEEQASNISECNNLQ